MLSDPWYPTAISEHRLYQIRCTHTSGGTRKYMLLVQCLLFLKNVLCKVTHSPIDTHWCPILPSAAIYVIPELMSNPSFETFRGRHGPVHCSNEEIMTI